MMTPGIESVGVAQVHSPLAVKPGTTVRHQKALKPLPPASAEDDQSHNAGADMIPEVEP